MARRYFPVGFQGLATVLILGVLIQIGHVVDSQGFEMCACGEQNYRAGLEARQFVPDDLFISTQSYLLYPWVAAIINNATGTIICTAVLINWREVLTTAHCAFRVDLQNNNGEITGDIHSQPVQASIILGIADGRTAATSSVPAVSIARGDIKYSGDYLNELKRRSFRYPFKEPPPFEFRFSFDKAFAVIHLRSLLVSGSATLTDEQVMERYSQFMFPICVREASLTPSVPVGSTVMTLGWGSANLALVTPSTLLPKPEDVLVAEGVIVASDNCRTAENIADPRNELVCVQLNDRAVTCFPDVGGPLQFQDGNYRWHLIGIAGSPNLHPRQMGAAFQYCQNADGNPSTFVDLRSPAATFALFGDNAGQRVSTITYNCRRFPIPA